MELVTSEEGAAHAQDQRASLVRAMAGRPGDVGLGDPFPSLDARARNDGHGVVVAAHRAVRRAFITLSGGEEVRKCDI